MRRYEVFSIAAEGQSTCEGISKVGGRTQSVPHAVFIVGCLATTAYTYPISRMRATCLPKF